MALAGRCSRQYPEESPMELLILLALLILLDLLALRYGYDSRDRLRSDEERLAVAGYGSER